MDTKLRNIKYSVVTKFLCWLLALLVFSLAFLTAGKFALCAYVLGVENFVTGEYKPFMESGMFSDYFMVDFFNSAAVARESYVTFSESAAAQKEQAVKEIKGAFLKSKADMIKAELQYAVNNWGDEYYLYENSADGYVDGEYVGDEVTSVQVDSYNSVEIKIEPTEGATTAPDNTTTTVPETEALIKPQTETTTMNSGRYSTFGNKNIPENISVAEYALATKEGLEFLRYESLVRGDAFQSSMACNISMTFNISAENKAAFDLHIDIPFTYGEDNVEEYISNEYDNAVDNIYRDNLSSGGAIETLESRENLKYYIVTLDGGVVSNIDDIPDDIRSKNNYVLFTNDKFEIKGFERAHIDETTASLNKGSILCMYYDETFRSGEDIYFKMFNSYNVACTENALYLLVQFIISVAVGIILLAFWLKSLGYKKGSATPNLYFIDKLPNDIHTILSLGLVALFGGTVGFLLIDFIENYGLDTQLFRYIFFAAIPVLAILTEWLGSLVRQKKCGESILKNSLIYKIFRLIFKACRKVFKMFKYKPKAFKVQVIFLFIAYALINLCFSVLTIVAWDNIGIIFILVALVFNTTVAYCLARYVKNLDKIIVASGEGKNVVFEDKRKVATSLLTLADNLSDSNAQLESAVAEAVKKEQMKTQLITNVSHDLKTPLTSLINYSDLLSKCDIEDEQAKGYIDTINVQSEKLKRLIEDLIEASKVSTGNVTLNKVKLNLSELTVQAIVEFTPEFEKNRNEIRFNEPDESITVFADGTKTYRVLSNLMNNARKYSAPNTRVYASVYREGDFGCFELKNISKEQLNISAEELTERFVRGDESRSKEGNGLGLSIAKDLCKLQGGSLHITIDGDLFKVTVKLPIG